MKKLLRILIAATLSMTVVLSLQGCGGSGKEGPGGEDDSGGTTAPSAPKSGKHEILTFKLESSKNIGVGANVNAVLAYCPYPGVNLVLLTVPETFNLAETTPTFTISDKATLKVGGLAATSGSTKMDLSNTLKVEVVAENSSVGTYYILARNGNAKYDNAVYKLMRVYGVPGVSVAVTKNEELVYAAGYGFADVENLKRVDENTLFRLASVSKSQTALCIMKLYEEGKIRMDDRLFGAGGIFEEEFKAPFVPNADKVTVENLMFHNSGWNYHIDDQIFASYGTPYYGLSLEKRIDWLVHHDELQKAIGTTYSYLNIGYSILGKVIEKITGEKFEDYLRSVVAEAGVTDMWIGASAKADRRANETVYYAQSGRTAYGNDMPDVVGACGAVIASPTELMKVMCHEDYGAVQPDILARETLDLMYTPSSNYNRYAHGWRVNGGWTKWASYHGGNLNGTANLWVRGKQGCNAAILTNSRSYGITDENGNDIDDQLYVIIGGIFADLGN